MNTVLLDQDLQVTLKTFLIEKISGVNSDQAFQAADLYLQVLRILSDLVQSTDPEGGEMSEALSRVFSAADGELERGLLPGGDSPTGGKIGRSRKKSKNSGESS